MHMRQGSAPRLREFRPAPVFHKHDSVLGAHAVVRDLEAMGGLISSSHSLSRLPSAPPRSSSSEPPPQPREAAAVEGPKQEPPPAEAFCTRPHAIGAASGLLLFGWLQFVELSAEQPLANEMLAVVALVAVFWMFEVLPLPVTSLLPMLLIPAFGILDHSLVASAYWGPVQMMFVGAFIVDVGIEHVMLHQRLALNILLRTGVERPFVVVASFSAISFCFSSVCSNTATVVMLVPFATGLLDTSAEQARARGEEHQAASLQRAVLLGIAFAANGGGIATLVGTPPNGVLAGQPSLHGEVGFANWFLFAAPIACCTLLIALAVLHFGVLRGVRLSLDEQSLRAQLQGLGPTSRDEVVAAGALALQVFLWVSRPYLLEPVFGPGLGDSATACGAAVLLFVVPSSERPGESVLTWSVAQQHLPWGILLLLGAGFAIAAGCEASGLTTALGGSLAEALSGLTDLPLVITIVAAVSLLTQLTSNTATANTLLPLLNAVAKAKLTNPLLLLLPTTIACSFAFVLPAATAPNSVIFATERLDIADFVVNGGITTGLSIAICSPLVYLMADTVFDVRAPYPRWACDDPESCAWVAVAGEVDGSSVEEQACAVVSDESCRLRNGTLVDLAATLAETAEPP
uniref:Citrate transporter-like domain-containing protein n=1 Tax=Emiliania huxleyi TaxID=2903 RepID=A0A7S3WAN4_EMIHU